MYKLLIKVIKTAKEGFCEASLREVTIQEYAG